MDNGECLMFNIQCSMFNNKLTYRLLMLFADLAGAVLPALLLSAALSSCQKELVYPKPPVNYGLNIRFEWNDSIPPAPDEMAVVAFSGESQPVRYPLPGYLGGEIDMVPDTYSLIAYNNDTDNGMRGVTWDGFEVYTVGADLRTMFQVFASTRNIPKAKDTDEQDTVWEPERIWTSALDSVAVDETSLGRPVTMPMRDATMVYSFIIYEVDNLSFIKSLVGSISGMSVSMYPSTHRPSNTQVIIAFPMDKTGDASIRGSLRTFGHCPNYEDGSFASHMLVIYAELNTGEKYYYTYDVTEQMHKQPHGGVIELSRLPIPKPITNGSGIQPDVDEWSEVHIDIDMKH